MRTTITPRGPFDLAQSMAFLDGFAPVQAVVGDDTVALGLTDDEGRAHAAVVRQESEAVLVEAGDEAAAGHVARILSLDIDATGLADVGRRDPVVARLLEQAPGRRPVLFGTPFASAVWAVLSQRTSRAQAARVQDALIERHGATLEVGGVAVPAFPGPDALVDLVAFPSVPAVKMQRIRGLARAALEGRLDAGLLRGMEQEEALAHLETLPGIGPFSAALVLIRGAGHPDVLVTPLAPLRRAVASAYDVETVDEATLARIGAPWRPFRSWVLFLLRTRLD